MTSDEAATSGCGEDVSLAVSMGSGLNKLSDVVVGNASAVETIASMPRDGRDGRLMRCDEVQLLSINSCNAETWNRVKK